MRAEERRCRELVKERSGNHCERCCRVFYRLSVHHRRKRSQGGLWTASNCVRLCGDGTTGCHGWVEANPTAAHTEGFHIRRGEDTELTPVLYRGRMAFLDDVGNVDYVHDSASSDVVAVNT